MMDFKGEKVGDLVVMTAGSLQQLRELVDGRWDACSSQMMEVDGSRMTMMAVGMLAVAEERVSSHGCKEACSNQEELVLPGQCLLIYRRQNRDTVEGERGEGGNGGWVAGRGIVAKVAWEGGWRWVRKGERE
ncbi:Hypothetical predicted protein [Prunus dulcis]|uniref:Uncharacterized protein n=1 Tax=Prunus dulcis TaxID=3755 RepID=A0A5E4EXR5_PRUDU|nr:hypothetical protein L3X38_012253 [Prunus dulcis]VVA20555.1 Hypothetical predicted protein [Prunus dulcis]